MSEVGDETGSERMMRILIEKGISEEFLAVARDKLDAPLSRGKAIDIMYRQAMINVQIGTTLVAIAAGDREKILACLDVLVPAMKSQNDYMAELMKAVLGEVIDVAGEQLDGR